MDGDGDGDGNGDRESISVTVANAHVDVECPMVFLTLKTPNLHHDASNDHPEVVDVIVDVSFVHQCVIVTSDGGCSSLIVDANGGAVPTFSVNSWTEAELCGAGSRHHETQQYPYRR